MKTLLLVFAAVLIGVEAKAQTVAVTGGVRDSATGQPVIGAIVEIGGATRRQAARTDEAGEFELSEVEPGVYRVVVRRIGYAPAAREVSVESGMKPLSFRITATAQRLNEVVVHGQGAGIFGRIGTATELKPIPGARVLVAGSRDSTATDSAGSYFLPVKRPGKYMVRVSAPGYIDEMFVVEVKRNAIADGSGLLDEGNGKRISRTLWQDFDQRVSWRTVNGGTLITGAELRQSGGDLATALLMSSALASLGAKLRVGVCVFVDGQPAPDLPLESIRPEEIRALEFYKLRTDSWKLLMNDWPPGGRCSPGPVRGPFPPGTYLDGAIVIWTR